MFRSFYLILNKNKGSINIDEIITDIFINITNI